MSTDMTHAPNDGSMASAPSPSQDGAGTAVAEIASALARASDQKVLEIVSLIDSLADRRVMDAMIAPLRQRIAGLRPTRPLTIQRLMFAPFDAAIVPTTAWTPALGLVPRGVLQPLITRLRPKIADVERLEAELRRLDPRDRDGRLRLGQVLWATAARHVPDIDPCGADWDAPGLVLADRQGVLNSMQLIFREMPRLCGVVRDADPRPGLLALFETAANCGLDGWTLLLNLLLDPAGGIAGETPPRFIEVTLECAMEIADTRPQSRIVKLLEAGTARAVDRLLDHVAAIAGDAGEVLPSDSAPLLAQLSRVVGPLAELSGSVVLRPEQTERVRRTRQEMVATCRRRLDLTMAEDVFTGLQRLVTSPKGVPAQEVEGLEMRARVVREFALRLQALGLIEAKADEGGGLDRWREPVAALLAEPRPVPAAPAAATVLTYQPPPALDAVMARFLRVVEIVFGTGGALELAGGAGWQAG